MKNARANAYTRISHIRARVRAGEERPHPALVRHLPLKGKAFGKDVSVLRESAIERRLRLELGRMGCLFYKFVSPGNNGVPDRIVITPGGHALFVELKTEHGRLSPVQLRQIKRLEDHGAAVFVVYGENYIEALLGWVRQMERR